MKQFVLTVSYDGAGYLGWQKTRMGPSIEATLEAALQQILQQVVVLDAASRTDAGVHARGQVVRFITHRNMTQDTLQLGCNALLPRDIRVLRVEERARTFHPTLDALGKEYHYRISLGPVQLPGERHTAWHFPLRLDVERMKLAASLLLGKHDFKAFCNQRKDLCYEDTVRSLSRCEIVASTDALRIEIEADRFLYRMARNIAGTLVYVGCGKLSCSELPDLLEAQDRTRVGITAPAHGLCLMRVHYSPLGDRESSGLST